MDKAGKLLVSIIFIFSFSKIAKADVGDTHYCNEGQACAYWKAQNFSGSILLNPIRDQLLKDYLNTLSPALSFLQWAKDNNDLAATFVAVTHALEHMTLLFKDGTRVCALNLLVKINAIEGDRTLMKLNHDLFYSWLKSGSRFEILSENGDIQKGKMDFDSHTSIGSSLHKGYDIQAATSNSIMPRIQINFRKSDDEADIDLDGFAPWKWGFVPNPHHLTYQNSDVRQWLKTYLKRYGDPGFSVFRYTYTPGHTESIAVTQN